MIRNIFRRGHLVTAAALLFSLWSTAAFAETLNPEGVNPHEQAPKKRITLEQKKAAAEARKKKQEEMAAKKGAPQEKTERAPDSLNVPAEESK